LLTNKERIQTLRPLYLYPLWILEGVGQLGGGGKRVTEKKDEDEEQ